MKNNKRIFYIGLGIGLTLLSGFIAKETLDWFYDNLYYSFGKPSLKVERRNGSSKIVFVQPITFLSSLPVKVNILKYEGNLYYKDILVGTALMKQLVLLKKTEVTTDIETVFSPSSGRLLSLGVNDPYQIIQVIQKGLSIKGKVHIKAGRFTLKIPVSDSVKL